MLKNIIAGCAALAVAGTVALSPVPASAQHFRGHGGGGWHGNHGGHGGWHRGGGWRRGGGALGGFAAGALIGGALASQPYYGYPAYAYSEPVYSDPVYEEPDYGGDAEAYCVQRFKSYDPASGTYLGYDGDRHPCP